MAYVNSLAAGSGSSSVAQMQTTSYSPTAGNSLIFGVKARTNAFSLTGYSGSGTPGDGVNSYNLIGYTLDSANQPQYTVTGSNIASGATSTTLSANWIRTTGAYAVGFSDGEWRQVTLTNGSAAVSWTTGLAATCTVNLVINPNLGTVAWYQAIGVAATAITPGAASGAAQIDGLILIEYKGLSAMAAGPAAAGSSGNNTNANSTSLAYFYQNDTGTTGANILTSGSVGISVNVLLLGISFQTGFDGNVPGAGTSPLAFTGRGSTFWSASSFLEDVSTASSAAATFSCPNQFDSYCSIALAVPTLALQPIYYNRRNVLYLNP